MSDPTITTAHEPTISSADKRTDRKLASSTPLLLANLVETLVPLLRNIALAHLLPPEQFGLAISLAVVLGLIEVLSDFGLPIFAVRKPDALPSATALATLHSLALIRSAWLALILLLLSPLIAHLFAAQSSIWLYALLGPVVLMRGFENLGVKEMMRRYAFGREALVIASSQSVGLAATIATAFAGAGMAAMIIGMIATAAVTLLLSHLLSPTPYRLGWQAQAAAEATAFGKPLLINGAAVALTTCDRLLVGAWLGPAVLALYNVAYGTATLPRSILARFLTSAFLPLFVEQRDRGRAMTPLLDIWVLSLSAIALLYGWGLGLLGDRALGLVFGSLYQPSRLFMCLAGMGVGVKILMLLPTPAAYADGMTRLISWGSILSALSMLPAAICLFVWRNLELFIFAAALAEFCALVVLALLACRSFAFTRSILLFAVVLPFASVGSLGMLAVMAPAMTFAGWLAACSAILICALAAYGIVLHRTGAGSILFAQA
ncbi:oligosaccharide flippase family protein [Labrys sp. 22185]|uniref:oligosaccharide flippase family protein n=1 Tax=Labrys sp. 22185 TaxID=3453888 RepID=UPI003F869F97